jgi:hypothetical protein
VKLVHIHLRRVRVARSRLAIVAVAIAAMLVAMVGSVAGASGSNSLAVKASEYTYQFKGHPKAGWTEIDFQNAGVENHMMEVVQLKPGVTAKQLKAAALSEDQSAFEKIAAPGASPNGVPGTPNLLSPKQHTSTMTQLAAGHYGALCFLPAPDGSPHVAHGMVKVFDVAKGKSSLKPPTSGVIDTTISDSAITFPAENIGRNFTTKVTNTGTTLHDFTLVKINSGKTIDDVKSYYDALFNGQKPAGEAPGELVGGILGLEPGGTAYLTQTLAAGHYGYASTQGDAPNDDFTKGLKGEFDVK